MTPKGIPTIQPAKDTEYTTPEDLFDGWWNEVGGFDMDPFCRPHHHTAQRVLENGGTICVPSSSAYTTNSWMAALAYGKHSRVLVDGLAHPWHGKVFMNPPYGPFLRKAIPYAVEQVECGNVGLVMALLPAKSEVQWWQEYVMQRWQKPGTWTTSVDIHPRVADLRFLKGRLHFGRGDGPARVGSVIVVWRR